MLHWLPENISTYGDHVDSVMRLIYFIVGPWFLLAEGVLFYFIFRYRRNQKRQGRKVRYQTGTTWKALSWVFVPALLILGFDLGIEVVQGPVWAEIKMQLPVTPDQIIRIQGKQFIWEFIQPGPDGYLDTADDIQTLNQLTVPVHEKIQFELTAADVIHSFWVPSLRLKQDAVPGRTIRGWFEATKEGTYIIGCAQLCGSGHGAMRGELHVVNSTDYQKWLEENR